MNTLDFAYAAAVVITAPVWMRKARGGWNERFGRIPTLAPTQASRPRILLHAVSVGEVNALRRLVPMLRDHAEIVISATTDTGLARAHALYADQAHVVRYPLDFSGSVARFLDAVRPDLVGLVELEVWPNFIRACERRGIPVAVINGRLSARSFNGYRRVRPVLAPTFSRLAHVAAQDDAVAARFRAMGVPPERVEITGSMKWDAAEFSLDPDRTQALARALGLDPARPLVVAGSTADLVGADAVTDPCEEALLHRVCPPGVQLLCAPRKPERFDAAFAAMGGPARCTRRSAPAPAPGPRDRFLLDTIGELRDAYALADVVVIGRTVGALHGSDPMEPAALGKPLIAGPRVGDFEAPFAALSADDAVVRSSRSTLAHDLATLLDDATRREHMGARARACVKARQGASRRHADLLLGLARVSPYDPHGRRGKEPA